MRVLRWLLVFVCPSYNNFRFKCLRVTGVWKIIFSNYSVINAIMWIKTAMLIVAGANTEYRGIAVGYRLGYRLWVTLTQGYSEYLRFITEYSGLYIHATYHCKIENQLSRIHWILPLLLLFNHHVSLRCLYYSHYSYAITLSVIYYNHYGVALVYLCNIDAILILHDSRTLHRQWRRHLIAP